MDKCRKSCDWGTLFGLSSADLTDEQLVKIEGAKRFEFVLVDSRVTKIIVGELEKGDFDTFRFLSSLSGEELKSNVLLYTTYNECHRKFGAQLEAKNQTSYIGRSEYCKWDFLDQENRFREWDRYIDGFKNSISLDKVNFIELYDKYSRVEELIKKLLDINSAHYISGRINNALFSSLSNERIDKYSKIILEKSPHDVCYLLQNQNLSKYHLIKVLRKISGKTEMPNINIAVKINKDILKEIPSVTRLRTLETLYCVMRKKDAVEDIKVEADFNDILFGVSLKYNERVKHVVYFFNKLVENNRRYP